MSTTISGVPIILMPDLGVVTDDSSIVGEHAGSGRFGAPALSTYAMGGSVVATGSTASRALPIRFADQLNVVDFGADPSGAADSTAAIQAAFNAGCGLFPTGVFMISAALTVTSTLIIRGAGRFKSTLKTTSAIADILTLTAPADIADLAFDSSVTRTNGTYVNFSSAGASRSRLSRFWMINGYLGVQISASDIQVVDGQIFQWVATGGGIQIDSGLALAISRCYLQQGVAPGAGFGIRLLNSGDLLIADCSICASGTALAVVPGSGQSVVSLWAHHTYFDTSLTGVDIEPTGTGSVSRCRFDNCWMSSATGDGIAIASPAAGSVSGVAFLGCHVFGNSGDGILFEDSHAQVTKIVDCEIAGNTANGINFFAGGNYFMVRGCKIGSSGGWGNNGGAAINLGAASSAYHITDNDLTGSTGSLVGAGVQTGGSPGRTEFIGRNIGYTDSTYGTASIAAAATSVVVTHGLAGAPPINRILLTALTGIGSAVSYWVSAVTATTFTISTQAAPGGVISIAWQARMACSA